MIFFFGVRTAHLNSVQNQQAICSYCKTQGSLIMHIYRRHFHLFWIPMFPINKEGITECTHCKNVLRIEEMSEDVKSEYLKVRKESKGPIWQFSGLILIGLFMIFITVFAILNSN